MTNKQTLVEPYSKEEIAKLTEEDIKRGCLEYRVDWNKKYRTLAEDGDPTDHVFYVGDGEPGLPLKTFSDFLTKGWDIPTLFAIDNNNQCWINDAHGGALEKCTAEVLLSEPDEGDEETRNFIRGYLDRPQLLRCTCCNSTGWVKE